MKLPLLSGESLVRLRAYGTEEAVEAGRELYRRGANPSDLFVVISGELQAVEERKNGIVITAERHAVGDFTADCQLFGRREATFTCRASRASEVLRISAEGMQRLVNEEPDLCEHIMHRLVQRQQERARQLQGGLTLIGSGSQPASIRLRQFLLRNSYPHRFVDYEETPSAALLIKSLADDGSELPVAFLANGDIKWNPSEAQLADAIGLTDGADPSQVYDVAIVGGGPGGLAAAVLAASGGLGTVLIEETACGGQAGTSSRIENYLGFPGGLSGQELARRSELQARRFGATMLISRRATAICQSSDGFKLSCQETVRARAVVLACGARYRRLDVPVHEVMDAPSVHYSATAFEASQCEGKVVIVTGGGNSAGQAATHLARSAQHVHLVIRGANLSVSMSDYLVRRIESNTRITIHRSSTIRTVERVMDHYRMLLDAGTSIGFDALFVLIGADPNTEWLPEELDLDSKGYIKTGQQNWQPSSAFATSLPGVFAIGDVRSGSLKRVASAVGEGSTVISDVERFLAAAADPKVVAASRTS